MGDQTAAEDAVNLFDDNFLLTDLGVLLEQINHQIKEVEIEAAQNNVLPMQLRTASGDWPMKSLLTAKAHTLNAIVTMRNMEQYAKTINIYHSAPEN